MSRVANAAELIRRAVDSRLLDVFTGFPARVEAYYPGSVPTIDAAPVVRRPLPTEEGETLNEELPVIPNVPILFPRGKGGTVAITWPLEKGDHVWIQVSIWCFDEWRRTGKISDPGDVRSHTLGNCYAVPGAAPDSEHLDQSSIAALVLEHPSEIRLGKDAAQYLALANLVKAELDKIVTTLGTAKDSTMALITYGTPYVAGDVACTIVKGK